jgi:cobyrinic acid a,c-diamide synthase
MLQAIKAYAENGGVIYAECGGFMYLLEYIEDSKMVGVFKGKSSLTSTLQRFGYIDIELKNDCLLGDAGDRLTGHEFHKSVSEVEGETLYRIKKTMGENVWECGYTYKNVIAGYPHISFIGNMKMLNNLLDYVSNYKDFS